MKKVKSKRWTGILPALLFPALSFSQAQPVNKADTVKPQRHELSAQQAIDYANKNNVQVKNALLDIQLQKQVNREFTSNAYPHINGNINSTYNPNIATQVIPNFISPATYQVLIDEGIKDGNGNPIVMPSEFGMIPAQFGVKYTATAGVSLSQILFDGQVFVGLQARSTLINFKSKNMEITQEVIKANIYKVYYQLVASKTQVELLDENISRFEKLLHDTRAIYDNGMAEKLDVDRVSVQLTNLRTEKNKVLTTISNGYYGLKVLLGMPIRDELVLTDSLTYDQVKRDILERSMYDYDDRKEYQYAELGRELNEYDLRRWKLSQIPTISLNGNYAKNAQRNQYNFFTTGTWFTISSVAVNINIPIFNGSYTRSKIAQAEIELKKTENEIEALKINIDNEVASSKNNFTTAISNLDAQKDNMDLAEKVYDQTKKKYETGIGSQTEINTAQTDLKAAQTNYITALYDAIIAKVDFLKATGKL